MIARIWRGQASALNAPHYREHATRRVLPQLALLPGHRGAYLLTRETKDGVEFLAVTRRVGSAAFASTWLPTEQSHVGAVLSGEPIAQEIGLSDFALRRDAFR